MDGAYKPHKWIITLTVMIGNTMAGLDMSIVNVALPSMRGTLGASVEEIAWVATGYMLSSVIIMPIIAFLSSRFGRKRFYIFSILLFTGASMLCGASWNLTSIVIFRILQGFGGGTLMPIAQSILRETFPPEEQGTAMGIFGMGVIMGPALGPTLGGWITDSYSWPWIFYINVPIGIISILMVMRFIKDPPYLVREKGKLDVAGLFFLAMGLGALQVFLERGNEKDWFASDLIRCLAVAALMGLGLFIWRELTTDKPVVNLRILKDTNFTSATLLNGILGMGLFAAMFTLPLFLQHALGLPCSQLRPGACTEGPCYGNCHAPCGQDLQQGRPETFRSSRAFGECLCLLSVFTPFPGCRLLGYLCSPVHPGSRLCPYFRRPGHGRLVHYRKTAHDCRSGTLHGGPDRVRQHWHRPCCDISYPGRNRELEYAYGACNTIQRLDIGVAQCPFLISIFPGC